MVIAMNAGFANEPELEEEALPNLEGIEDFLKYMDGPHSVGLDGMNRNMRDMILLMMELQGYETGYRSQQLTGFGHTSMIMSGLHPGDAKKRRLDEQFWEEFYKMLSQLDAQFDIVIAHVQKRIDHVQAHIAEELQVIDAQIAAQATNDAHVETLKAGHERRNVLKWLLRRLDRHEEKLQEAETTEEIVQLHQKVEQDIEDVKQGNVSANRSANRPSPLTEISNFVRGKHKKAKTSEHEFGLDPHADSEEGKDSSGKSGKGGKGGRGSASGSASGESAAGDEDDLPPPPVSPEGF